jgi:branched-chain amino acid transport system ATP-binding protein
MLQLQEVSKSFGGLQVLNRVDAKIAHSEIVGLIGPNGAGKSTLFNLITGFYQPTRGAIQFEKQSLLGKAPHKITHLGIARTFQLVKIFPSLTALENVSVGAMFGRRKGSGRKALLPEECLELVGIESRRNLLSAHLTFCDRRKVEIARAVAAAPRLLLLDEPLAGLNDTETRKMITVIREIREKTGTAILWVEHKIEAIFSLCERLIVIDFGQKIAEGTPKEITHNNAVIEAYLGKGKKEY